MRGRRRAGGVPGIFGIMLAMALFTRFKGGNILSGFDLARRVMSDLPEEAAQAMGMSRWRALRRVVLPSAIRRTLPAYSNEVVMMLHSTSLASAVPSMLDVTAAASRIYSDFYLPFEAYLAAAAIYLACTFCLIGLFKLAERHFLAHLAPRSRRRLCRWGRSREILCGPAGCRPGLLRARQHGTLIPQRRGQPLVPPGPAGPARPGSRGAAGLAA